MSRIPRTPVHWPRMKVRGRRNRAKLAARHRHRIVIPFAVPTVEANGVYRFDAVAAWEPGAFRIEHSSVRDGYGRIMPGSQGGQAAPAEPPRRPRNEWSMSFTTEPGVFDRLAALLDGREGRVNASG